MMGLGTTEIVIIMLGLVVLFGAKRLPDLGKGLGEGLRGFKKGLKGEDEGGGVGELRKGEVDSDPQDPEK